MMSKSLYHAYMSHVCFRHPILSRAEVLRIARVQESDHDAIYYVLLFYMQVSVPSISKARQVTNTQPQLNSILVGGKRYAPLTTDDLQSVFLLYWSMNQKQLQKMLVVYFAFICHTEQIRRNCKCVDIMSNPLLIWSNMISHADGVLLELVIISSNFFCQTVK